jgi:hypothetical protein
MWSAERALNWCSNFEKYENIPLPRADYPTTLANADIAATVRLQQISDIRRNKEIAINEAANQKDTQQVRRPNSANCNKRCNISNNVADNNDAKKLQSQCKLVEGNGLDVSHSIQREGNSPIPPDSRISASRQSKRKENLEKEHNIIQARESSKQSQRKKSIERGKIEKIEWDETRALAEELRENATAKLVDKVKQMRKKKCGKSKAIENARMCSSLLSAMGKFAVSRTIQENEAKRTEILRQKVMKARKIEITPDEFHNVSSTSTASIDKTVSMLLDVIHQDGKNKCSNVGSKDTSNNFNDSSCNITSPQKEELEDDKSSAVDLLSFNCSQYENSYSVHSS